MTKRIYIVDDTPEILSFCSFILERESYKISTASSGEEAISLFDSEGNPDLLITDIEMPKMDGYDLIRHLQNRGNTHPILVHSSRVDQDIPDYNGLVESLHKPSDLNEFKGIVSRLLGD